MDQVGKMLENVDSMQEIVGEDLGLADWLGEKMEKKFNYVISRIADENAKEMREGIQLP